MRLQIFRYGFLLILLLCLGSGAAQGTSQAVYPSGTSVTAGYRINPSTVPVTDTLVLEQWLVNRSAGDITALHFTFQLPPGLLPIGRSALVGGSPVPFTIEYSGGPGTLKSWHIVLDSPTGSPDTRIRPGDSAHVVLLVRIGAAGQYAISLLGSVFSAGGEAHFAIDGPGTTVITAVGDNCCLLRGNVDGAGMVTVADLTYLVNFLFRGGLSAPCPVEADVNGLGSYGITVTDLTFLVNLLFRGGAPPPPCN